MTVGVMSKNGGYGKLRSPYLVGGRVILFVFFDFSVFLLVEWSFSSAVDIKQYYRKYMMGLTLVAFRLIVSIIDYIISNYLCTLLLSKKYVKREDIA